MKRIYISAALASAANLNAARTRYELLATEISKVGFNPYLPHQKTDPERDPSVLPVDVFEVDITELRSADYVVALLDEASLGVGAELVFAVAWEIPLVAAWKRSTKLSRFIEGFLRKQSNVVLCRYETISEISEALLNLSELRLNDINPSEITHSQVIENWNENKLCIRP